MLTHGGQCVFAVVAVLISYPCASSRSCRISTLAGLSSTTRIRGGYALRVISAAGTRDLGEQQARAVGLGHIAVASRRKAFLSSPLSA